MVELLAFANGVNALGLPVLGLVSLLASKLAQGPAKRQAERLFLAALALVTVVTIRTATLSDPAWLAHSLTLMLMVVGAVFVASPAATVNGER